MMKFLLSALFVLGVIGFGQAQQCPNGTFQLLGGDGRCFMVSQDRRPSTFADVFCNGLGGNLISIHDDYNNGYVGEIVGQQLNASTTFWLGATRQSGGNGSFTWLDGTAFDYSNFAPGHPIDGRNCVAQQSRTGAWVSEPCYNSFYYVCVVPGGGPGPSTVSTSKPPGSTTQGGGGTNCPNGNWTVFNGYCYQFGGAPVEYPCDDPTCLTWDQAEAACVGQGAHLASIHNDAEQNFVQNQLVPQNGVDFWTWLGASTPNDGTNNSFNWTDGTPFDYNNWYSGYPSFLSTPDCVHIDPYFSGFWTDDICNIGLSYICKMPAN